VSRNDDELSIEQASVNAQPTSRFCSVAVTLASEFGTLLNSTEALNAFGILRGADFDFLRPSFAALSSITGART
jgi:hypothetical protein